MCLKKTKHENKIQKFKIIQKFKMKKKKGLKKFETWFTFYWIFFYKI